MPVADFKLHCSTSLRCWDAENQEPIKHHCNGWAVRMQAFALMFQTALCSMETTRALTPDGIDWYVERFSPSIARSASPIVLIPSGEGDCHNLQALAKLLAHAGYDVVSFDLPGFSRSKAPKEACTTITPRLVAKQIVTILDELKIHKATFFGNSSGGGAVLALVALYPERVVCGVVHEVPIGPTLSPLADLATKPDAEITSFCEDFFRNKFIERENDGQAKWDALGADYHARLKKNYVTWIHGLVGSYTAQTEELATTENLQKRPVFWTVGTLTGRERFAKDFEVAEKAGIEVRTDVVNSLHFPYVTVPERLAEWVAQCVQQVDQ